MMLDTETSKKADGTSDNHVVIWTLSVRAFDTNIATLWGRKPSELAECVDMLISHMKGDDTFIFVHNLAYDWVFIRKFFFERFGTPVNQLNTKSHYPIYLQFENGLILRDSLCIAQRSLEKWAKDLDVEHQKAVGRWEYSKIRDQDETYSDDELMYAEHDTLAGVECLQATINALDKQVATLPWTATGIPREEIRKIGKDHRARDRFKRMSMTYDQQVECEQVFHGGYTHANRHVIGWNHQAVCYDFSSSYPYVALTAKFPSEAFVHLGDRSVPDILKYMDSYAFMFRLILIRPRLKDDSIPMPVLQTAKCVKLVNGISDNGRVLCAEYIEIYITEMDLDIITRQYAYDRHICTDVYAAHKDYLPRWYTDYIFRLYEDKTRLKGKDKVLYSIAKAKLNASSFGMMVQRPVRDEIQEDWDTGEYESISADPRVLYDKYLNNHNSILPYQWGVWITAHAQHNLFDLGACVEGIWLYSDTDSCYADKWDEGKLAEYNQSCKDKLQANGYGPVLHEGCEYWLGVAELDGVYSEFITQGAKRYCGRSESDGKLHITVAGVPKKGAACLMDDIRNFRPGLIFTGTVTGKLTHTYHYVDSIYIDGHGNETGDSIDLTPCDYLLDSVYTVDWEQIYKDEIEIQVYEEDILL